ncbi:hypothetical protein DRE_00443 [Drechslerella stenobrocha 248]|uniref:Uncharacterized protein n=1 Tax=Drechslerella stenobrocha 248 TaxID=1043628 RepID=W7IER2_9PEZI|nr:hypothetical protein DRE_00443 [Drechslerella stenobrocha 248]
MPTRPPTLELRNPPLNHRPSLPIELRALASSNLPVSGLTRPKTAYGPTGPSQYSLVPVNGRGAQQGSTRTSNTQSPQPRERAYTLQALESPPRAASLARPIDAASTHPLCCSATNNEQRVSQTSRRNANSTRVSKRGIPEETEFGPRDKGTSPNFPTILIPTNWSAQGATRHGLSRAASYNSLREDASGIPTVWTNGDQQSPKASPTGAQSAHMESYALPSRQSSKNMGDTVQMVIPESPVDGTMNSVSTTNSSILDSFKRRSRSPQPIPDKSPLRGATPSKRSPSIRATGNNSSEIPIKVRRRDTGYRPNRAPPHSPPPSLPPLIATPPIPRSPGARAPGAITRAPSSSMLQGPRNTMGVTDQDTLPIDTEDGTDINRPFSYVTGTTRPSTMNMNEGMESRFSFSPVDEKLDSIPASSTRDSSLSPHEGSHDTFGKATAEEAVDSFFLATQNGMETARPSLEEIEETEPQLARYVSITSTSGSCRTTIDFKPSAESLHSRMLSKSTIRTMDMHLEGEEAAQEGTCTDIEDATASSLLSRPNSSASVAQRGRPRPLYGIVDSADTDSEGIGSAYSPTLSMLNFYSSSSAARYSIATGPPSTRSSLAARRNSYVPNISIPKPQLYIHANAQLEIPHREVNHTVATIGADGNALLSTETGTLATTGNGSISSATSPASFTTAGSSSSSSASSSSPGLNAAINVGAPVPMNTAIPIPTPQIYSESAEDLSPDMLQMQMHRQPSYLAFPKRHYGDLESSSPSPGFKPAMSMTDLAIHESEISSGMLNTYIVADANVGSGMGINTNNRSVSEGTQSTLDNSSFRDLDMKSNSGLLDSSDEVASAMGSSGYSDASGEFDLEIGGGGGGGSDMEDAKPADNAARRKKNRAIVFGANGDMDRIAFEDGRGRLRERRLV